MSPVFPPEPSQPRAPHGSKKKPIQTQTEENPTPMSNTHVHMTADEEIAVDLTDTDGENWAFNLSAVAAAELADRIAEALA